MDRLLAKNVFLKDDFLKNLAMPEDRLADILKSTEWDAFSSSLLSIRGRLACKDILAYFRPALDKIAPEPEEGWLSYAYRVAISRMFPETSSIPPSDARDGALCCLQLLQNLFDHERQTMPFDFWLDFRFCSEDELSQSTVKEEYRQFLRSFREEYVYEALRLGREATPFRTMEHIAGVHHVAMTVARAFRQNGGHVDLGLMSAAAAGHDIGKFGCRPGERVPYLHYYYTDQWFTARHLPITGLIASNHSVWDLEIENLAAESLLLVYADFRVKQERTPEGGEIAKLFSLKEAFDVILKKLDNVDAAKKKRYEYVYAKLQDFEEYLEASGVDITLEGRNTTPLPKKNAALMEFGEAERALRHTAVNHNLRLMHRLTRERLFAATLEQARSERSPARIRAYISVFEEYFTYLSAAQKEQTLAFLYELLLAADGDIRLHAAQLMGRILAKFLSGYKKELPADAPPNPLDDRPFALWDAYLEKLVHPDRRLTALQTSMIRCEAKTVTGALLQNCSEADAPRFAETLLKNFRDPGATEPETAFVLMDTVMSLPLVHITKPLCLAEFAAWWMEHGNAAQKAASLRLLRWIHPILGQDALGLVIPAVLRADCNENTSLLFLHAQLLGQLGRDTASCWSRLARPEVLSSVFLDNLKTATHWILKAANVEYLLELSSREKGTNLLHIATHFSNLVKVSEQVAVRRMAGMALLHLAPLLAPDARNEIAVELTDALETGQIEIVQYIPGYLGQLVLWLPPKELDEVIAEMETLRSSPSNNVAAAALATVGSIAEHYAVYGERFPEPEPAREKRWQRLIGFLLKGLSAWRDALRQESLRVLGECLFSSGFLRYEEKTSLFTFAAKKILFLLGEQEEKGLTFFYTAAALSHIYRFIVQYHVETGAFAPAAPKRVAFFPGTFDPFSLSHKGIVTAIRDMGFEVYLSVDEFSWSKNAQPALYRRKIVCISIADEFDVYLFPHDFPVNLATPSDLQKLLAAFPGREVFLTAGSDVIANASSYRVPPSPGSVHSMNHIVFRRSSGNDEWGTEADFRNITGQVIRLQLPTHLEGISSTRIRENIDLGRDVAHLLDPAVQEFIFQKSLYLREPQYKQMVRTSDLEFLSCVSSGLPEEVQDAFPKAKLGPQEEILLLKSRSAQAPGFLAMATLRKIQPGMLYQAVGDENLAHYIRTRTAGKILLLTGMHLSRLAEKERDAGQIMMTEVLSRAMAEDCSYAVWWAEETGPNTLRLLELQGFLPAEIHTSRPLMLVDMRSPSVLLQNIPTTLKEPFASDHQVLTAIHMAHARLQGAICSLFPGSLVLSLDARVIYHRLADRITEINDVPREPTSPRILGPKMCVPIGMFLKGCTVPNTVTHTIYADNVFAFDLRSYRTEAFPGYAPLESQIRTVHSFRRPVVLVDDSLHIGKRMASLDALFRKEQVDISQILVGLLSSRGRDLMEAHGRSAEGIYCVPDMRFWFAEAAMYPFLGGNTVKGVDGMTKGLASAVNLILPYAFPEAFHTCERQALYEFSRTCIENSRSIFLALENSFRMRYARNLTLSCLNEAVIYPLVPDKGNAAQYDTARSASSCLEEDLKLLSRMHDFLK